MLDASQTNATPFSYWTLLVVPTDAPRSFGNHRVMADNTDLVNKPTERTQSFQAYYLGAVMTKA
ncbi:hypothetical protein RMSM_04818 [Rhodopirellula maiorica SM1]|uniref:Uncharacterized protein n=1 Tax=Rhodopirellula maiorica SM1 TaxID=1265738 RepID=M5RSA0_9BACT|nr:hypothetical protein RMSM_04818 [Rhodopirellula maiorica SM1]